MKLHVISKTIKQRDKLAIVVKCLLNGAKICAVVQKLNGVMFTQAVRTYNAFYPQSLTGSTDIVVNGLSCPVAAFVRPMLKDIYVTADRAQSVQKLGR